PSACALMRMLMSFDTRMTGRSACFFCRWVMTPMIWLSALPLGRPAGSWPLIASVCRKRRPVALSDSPRASGMPSAMGPLCFDTISSRKRLAWRALRAASEMPFLLLSSSSSVMIGRNTSCSSNRNRLVGSCISTLVSRTKSLVTARRGSFGDRRLDIVVLGESDPSAGCGDCSSGFNKVEYLLDVTRHLHSAPFLADDALPVQHEGAALDATHFLAVHVLHLDDAELLAHGLVLVGEQLEGEAHLGLEALVGLQAVARDPEDRAAGLLELRMEIAEALALGGAAGRVVLGVEVQDDELGRRGGKCGGEAEGLAPRAREAEVADRFLGHLIRRHSECVGTPVRKIVTPARGRMQALFFQGLVTGT